MLSARAAGWQQYLIGFLQQSDKMEKQKPETKKTTSVHTHEHKSILMQAESGKVVLKNMKIKTVPIPWTTVRLAFIDFAHIPTARHRSESPGARLALLLSTAVNWHHAILGSWNPPSSKNSKALVKLNNWSRQSLNAKKCCDATTQRSFFSFKNEEMTNDTSQLQQLICCFIAFEWLANHFMFIYTFL